MGSGTGMEDNEVGAGMDDRDGSFCEIPTEPFGNDVGIKNGGAMIKGNMSNEKGKYIE